MATTGKRSLEYWVTQALEAEGKSGPCCQITLSRVTILPSGHEHLTEMHTCRKPDDKPWDAAAVTTLLRTKAELYCQDLQGETRFALTAKYGKEDADDLHPFGITSDKGFSSLGSYPANDAGAKAQGMELTQIIVKNTFGMQGGLMETAKYFIDRLDRENRELRTENREMFGMLRETLMKQVELDHVKRMKEMEFRRATEERRMIIALAPALINQLAGKELFPQNSEDTSLLEAIAKVVPEEMVKNLQIMLPAPIGGMLYERFTRALKEENAARALEQRAAGLLAPGDEGLQ